MATLTITYSNKIPTISWPIYPSETPDHFNLEWAVTALGGWVQVNELPIDVLFYQDTTHPLTTDRRIYYRVTAVMPDGSSVVHAGPALYTQTLRQARVQRIITAIQNRHALMLEKFSGEVCNVFIRRSAGTTCGCVVYSGDSAHLGDVNSLCPECYNTGIVGGYTKLTGIQVRIRSAQESIEEVQAGIKLTDSRVGWVGNYPVFDVGDIIERQNGERFSVVNSKPREFQGQSTFQLMTLIQLEPQHMLHQVV